jgi:mannose-6-phosphate isomerase-like protein (cupin superfamily)
MFITPDAMTYQVREKMRDGDGAVKITSLPKEALPAKCRLAAQMVLEKGCSIGTHPHENETEIYWCISGQGFTDDGWTTKTFRPGDATSTGGGASHSIRNERDEPLVVMAFIILD